MFKKYIPDAGVAIFVIIWGVVGYMFLITAPRNDTIEINCSIAEISPDIPVEAKELCRKARSGRI